MNDSSSTFPPLIHEDRIREFNSYSETERAAVVYSYIAEGLSFRRLDSEVLKCSFESRGWQSMGICHYLGLSATHKGFFAGWSGSDILHYLYRCSSDPDICIIFYYVAKHLGESASLTDRDKNEVLMLESTAPKEELFEKDWIQNTLLKGTEGMEMIDHSLLSLPDAAGQGVPVIIRNTECFVRSTTIKESVKSLYDYRCQICGEVVLCSGWKHQMRRKEEWKYLSADVHHILPLSDGGPDERRNMLCLCPTCHRKFHSGEYRLKPSGRMIAVSNELLGRTLELRVKHQIELY